MFHFYPRSPCGERHGHETTPYRVVISIHSLLAESDPGKVSSVLPGLAFLSTLSLRRATQGDLFQCQDTGISIHALLAESDARCPYTAPVTMSISIHALLAESDSGQPGTFACVADFYPRSPCGERPQDAMSNRLSNVFLSTLSLRRATPIVRPLLERCQISIHALLAESDCTTIITICIAWKFLSTLSLRRATQLIDERCKLDNFYPRSPCGERRNTRNSAETT